jgi:UDP-glucose 4-epimerase
MSKCLVLGANGFIGSHLVDSLIAEGHTVRAFDRFRGRGPRFNASDSIELFEGDFMNRHDITNALNGIEFVFHLVSTTTPATAEDDPLIDVDTNIRMSITLFQECVSAHVKRVIYSSTGGAIYGINDHQPYTETDLPLPISPYAIGKLTTEHYLRYFKRKHNLDSTVFRISNPYGERQPIGRRQGVIPIFLEQLAEDQPITVLGDGSMKRDYIYVKDVARILALSISRDLQEHVYNVGSGTGASINELIATMETVTAKKFTINYKDMPATYVQEVVLNIDRLRAEFPEISTATKLEAGIKETWQYIIAQKESDDE